MRRLTLKSLSLKVWKPVLASVLSSLLLLGPIFTCCRLNESFAEAIGRAMGSGVGMPETGLEPVAGKAHAECHGHATAATPLLPLPLQGDEEPALQADEPCLSSVILAPKAVQTTALDLDGLLLGPSPRHAGLPVAGGVRIPRAQVQGEGGPPVYLRTLRLLV